jgi:hypothetical protein
MKRINLKVEEWATGFRSIANISVRVLVMFFAVGMFAVSCGKDDDDDGGDNGGNGGGAIAGNVLPSAKGYLTVNGLAAHNGKYIRAGGSIGGIVGLGINGLTGTINNFTYHPVKIEGGTAKIPLYTVVATATKPADYYRAYDGSGTGDLMVHIITVATYTDATEGSVISEASLNGRTRYFTGISFSGGNATKNWTDGDDLYGDDL